MEKLLDVLDTPSESVQRAVSSCLAPLMQSKQVSWDARLVVLIVVTSMYTYDCHEQLSAAISTAFSLAV